MLKIQLGVQEHRSTTFGSLVAWQYSIMKAITLSSRVRLRSMSSQMDLISPQYHINKASKSSRHVAAIPAEWCDVVLSFAFTLETLAQVGSQTTIMWRTLQRCSTTSSSMATTLRGQCGRPSQVGGSSLSHTPGAAHAKTEAQIAYELRFRHSIYGWKDNFII
jgi:hypothetical protein